MSAVTAEAHDEWAAKEGPPRHWKFPDKAGTDQEFDGWLLVSDSTEMEESVHWTEMEVYLTRSDHYVMRVLGRSVIYHLHGSSCNTGDPQPGWKMRNEIDLEACQKCHPPKDYRNPARADEVFDVEVDIPTITRAETPAQLIRSMYKRNDRGEFELSYLSARVLRQLRRKDPAVNRELSKPKNLN